MLRGKGTLIPIQKGLLHEIGKNKRLFFGGALESLAVVEQRQQFTELYRRFFLTARLCHDLKETEEHGSTLILLHAYHLPVEFQQLEGAYLPQDFWSSVKTEAQQNLERYAAPLRPKGLEEELIVREGYPATVLEEEALDREADLIVIGTRGLSGLKHLLLGSVAERVVQKSPCPVLTVKTRE